MLPAPLVMVFYIVTSSTCLLAVLFCLVANIIALKFMGECFGSLMNSQWGEEACF